MIYAISFLISVFISYYVPRYEKNIKLKAWKIVIDKRKMHREKLMFASMILPILVSACRYGIGTDYFYTYIPQFNAIVRGEKSYYEIGFYILNKGIALFTENAQWLIVICSILTIGICYRQIFKESESYALSICLFYLSFFYFISLNNVRQSLASAFLLIGIEKFIYGEKIKFIFWVLIASSLHRVSLVFLVLFFADRFCLSAIPYGVFSCVIFFIGRIIAPKVLTILTTHIPRLNIYLHASELAIYKQKTIGSMYMLIQFAIIAIYVYLDVNGKELSEKKDQIEWNFTKWTQCILFGIIAMDGVIPATYRIARIFSFTQFILLPNAIEKKEKNKHNKICIWGIVIGMYLIYFAQNVLRGAEEVLPYHSIFNK